MNTFAALAFSNILQLIAAFKNGAVFEIVFKDGTAPYAVTDLSEAPNGKLRATYKSHSGFTFTSDDFGADGRHALGNHCWFRMVKEADPQPFLKQFVNGTPAYNPKTREIVVGVSFVKGAIEVLLRDESGKERVSTRYDHEGRHRWVPERSLVLGDLPPKPAVLKDVEFAVFHSRLGGLGAYAVGSEAHAMHLRTGTKFFHTVTVKVPA